MFARLKIVCMFTLILVISIIPSLVEADTLYVPGSTIGYYYNDVWNTYQKMPINVYVDDSGNVYIDGGDGLIHARGFLYANERQAFIKLLYKGLRWGEIAKNKHIETTKLLGSFMKNDGQFPYGIKLYFISIQDGKDFGIVLKMKDFDNPFYKITLFLRPKEIPQLIKLLNVVPATVKKLKANEAKAKMLK